jgi:hypothetical protein
MMKTLLLASAAVLTLGVGSAFAATDSTGFGNPQPAATTAQTGTSPAPAQSTAPGSYAYNNGQFNGQFSAAPSAPAPAMKMVPATPLGAAEAYQGDAPGGA